MGRMKAIFILVTCLWCHPSLAAFVWGAGTYLGGGLLSAYLLGVRPYGVLVWSEDGIWNNSPPIDAPLYVQIGDHKGLIYFAQLDDLGAADQSDGWYTLPSSMTDNRPEWLGKSDSVTIPSSVHSPEHLHLGSVDLFLLSTQQLATGADSTKLELGYMFQHGKQYRVIQEHRDGAVRPIRIVVIPDSMPLFVGSIVTLVGYTIVAAIPTSLMSTAGFAMSRRVRRTTSATDSL